MLYEENLLPTGNIASFTYPHAPQSAVPQISQPAKLHDTSLWDAFKSGDESAFIAIYKNYCNVLYNYGCQFCLDKEMVKDCLQDFFIYLRKNKTGFGKTDCIKFYLLKAFKRRVIEYIRKQQARSENGSFSDMSQFPVELSSESQFVNRQTKAEQLEKLGKAMKGLRSKEREAIYYFYYEGLSYEQIAEILKFTHISSARRIMYRGLKHLRNQFH